MPKTKSTKPAKAKAKAKSTRKPNAAFMKPVQPDDRLAAIGAKPLPRSELTKKLWVHEDKLQDSKKRTQINADDALKGVFDEKAGLDVRDDQARLGASEVRSRFTTSRTR